MIAAMRSNQTGAATIAIDVTAALCLGAAVALAVAKLAVLSGDAMNVAVAASGTIAATLAFVALARVPASPPTLAEFEPVELPEPLEELLLDQHVTPPSRVVRLFGAQPLPAPGELVTRIADYLETGRPAPSGGAAAGNGPSSDASAALHAALADIRRSLR